MKRRILLTILCLMTIFCSIAPVSGLVSKESTLNGEKLYLVEGEKITKKELLSTLCNTEVGNIKFSDPLKLAGKNIDLYCTYENNSVAFNDMLKQYFDIIDFLNKNGVFTEKVTESNFEEFYYAMLNMDADIDMPEELDRQIALITAFYDIYENVEVNNEIKTLVEEYSSLSAARQYFMGNDLLNRIDELVPSYSDNFGTIVPLTSDPVYSINASINVSSASAYANSWATIRNAAKYYSFTSADCTNFMSQILEASGVSQVVYDSEHSGWWHKRTPWYLSGTVIYEHSHSRSWTMADVFSRYMGVTVSTTSLTSWSRDLREGHFVALDFSNDGSWDHMGYVTGHGTTLLSYEVPGQNYCIG